ncbi:DUF3324 domain-containing protein [Enterococcus wangshanyuanii]|uniref:Cell surface protein n=1 Tax=Enterococcus wangshanyuanii TaxID=2005703 RepID=A0ABQ1PPT8_9ENTE|nr:DUF3324 domain-containing protein [Enterococcus wangshanyuanii]GGD00605.1 cell surface protein [Enterococcus wangshanyuanii]
MIKKIYALILSSLLVLSMTANSSTVFAKDDQELLGYVVSAVLPNTQLDKEKTYFYVQTVPGEEQDLEIKVKSTRKEPVKLKVFVKDAVTGMNGEIGYKEPTDKSMNYDKTLEDPVSSMIEIKEKELTVENFEEKTIHLKMTPPNEHYSGVKLGAIGIGLAEEEKGSKGVSTGFAYEIGVIFSETGEEFNNSASLNLIDVKAALHNGKKMVLANLQNPEPKVLENLNISATMKDKDGKVVKESKVQGYSMAPNTNFDYGMDWGIAEMPSGVYILELEVKNDFNNWSFKKEFTITNKQASEMNKASLFRVITPTIIKVLASILGALTVIILFIIVIRRKKWEKEWKKIRIMKKKRKRNNGRIQRTKSR